MDPRTDQGVMFLRVAQDLPVHKRAKVKQKKKKVRRWHDSETTSKGMPNLINRNLTLLHHYCA